MHTETDKQIKTTLGDPILRLLMFYFLNPKMETRDRIPRGRGRGTPHIKGVGMRAGNFGIKPLKETDLGVAQAFLDP